jgi:large subunit ribosomal protein L13
MRNKFDTHYVKKDDISRSWVLIDATEQTLGRLASEVAVLLRGKNKTNFQPSVDVGDYVIVINSSKIKVTGNKASGKIYNWYTGYPGGLKSRNFSSLQAEHPSRVFQLAVKRMLPKGRLGRQMIKKLNIYDGAEHNQSAQNPTLITI